MDEIVYALSGYTIKEDHSKFFIAKTALWGGSHHWSKGYGSLTQYLTTNQILELWCCKTKWEIDAAQRALRNLYDNEYLDRPKEQRKSPNTRSKTLIYQRTDKAARHVEEANVLAHRSNSFPHELITDFFFSFPLLYWVKNRAGFDMVTTLELMNGAVIETKQGDFQIPEGVRNVKDPFKIDDVRFDTTPMVSGPNVYICNECVALCVEIFKDNYKTDPKRYRMDEPLSKRLKEFRERDKDKK